MQMSFAVRMENKEGKILLVKHKVNSRWGPPGGHSVIEDNPRRRMEDSIPAWMAAVIRETYEETGITIALRSSVAMRRLDVVGIFSTRRDGIIGYVFDITAECYHCDDQILVPANEETSEARWFSQEAIHQLFAQGELRKPEFNLHWLVADRTREELKFLYPGYADFVSDRRINYSPACHEMIG